MVLFKTDSNNVRSVTGVGGGVLFERQRLELERQAAFARASLARARGGDLVGPDELRMDPVMAAHLGLGSAGK